MQKLHKFSSSSVNLGIDLLTLQNGGLDKSKDLDLRLNCSDGYLLTHKTLLPIYQTSTSSKSTEQLENHLEIESISLLNLTIIQASKLLFLLYTGDALLSKSDHKAIKPILEALQIFHVKPTRGPTPPRTINTRRSSSAATTGIPATSGSTTTGSSKEELTRRKIAGVQNLPNGQDGEEHVYIFGDGTIMEIPMPTSPSPPTNLVYNLNGQLILNESSSTEKGFHCPPCSLIFCDSADFLTHSSSPSCLNHSPPPPTTPTIKVIKLEPGFIKVEEHVDTVYFEDDPCSSPDLQGAQAEDQQLFGGGPLNLCLICVHPCNNPTELMVHSKQKHLISSEKDYDFGSWTCKWCHMTCGSPQLSVFLQHAYHCKKETKMSRIRSASKSPPRNKRRKTQTPPLITSNDNLSPSSPSTPSLPPTPGTPQHLKDKLSQLIKEPEEPAPPELKPIIKNTFRIPKISPAQKSPILTDDDPHCPTPLIPRLPSATARRPKSLAIPNNLNNRKSNFLEVKAPLLSSNALKKLAIVPLNQSGIKRKATEVAVSSVSSIKKQKKKEEPRIISPWTCRRCPTKTFASQKEYMHHDCRQYKNVKVH